jgi:hypothetical protein
MCIGVSAVFNQCGKRNRGREEDDILTPNVDVDGGMGCQQHEHLTLLMVLFASDPGA